MGRRGRCLVLALVVALAACGGTGSVAPVPAEAPAPPPPPPPPPPSPIVHLVPDDVAQVGAFACIDTLPAGLDLVVDVRVVETTDPVALADAIAGADAATGVTLEVDALTAAALDADGLLAPLPPGIPAAASVVDLDGVWLGPDGAPRGVPLQYSPVALVVNQRFLADFLFVPSDLVDATWNPEDGGRFGRIIAELTRDSNGYSGAQDRFDPAQVAWYGLALHGGGGPFLVNDVGSLAATTGHRFVDAEGAPAVDDPRLAATADWVRGLIDRGLTPDLDRTRQLGGGIGVWRTGQAVMTIAPLSEAARYLAEEAVSPLILPLPAGPEGRASLVVAHGAVLAAGAPDPEDAAAWLAHLASAGCRDLAAAEAALITGGVAVQDEALAAFTGHLIDGTGVIVPSRPDLAAAVGPALESVLRDGAPAVDALAAAAAVVSGGAAGEAGDTG